MGSFSHSDVDVLLVLQHHDGGCTDTERRESRIIPTKGTCAVLASYADVVCAIDGSDFRQKRAIVSNCKKNSYQQSDSDSAAVAGGSGTSNITSASVAHCAQLVVREQESMGNVLPAGRQDPLVCCATQRRTSSRNCGRRGQDEQSRSCKIP